MELNIPQHIEQLCCKVGTKYHLLDCGHAVITPEIQACAVNCFNPDNNENYCCHDCEEISEINSLLGDLKVTLFTVMRPWTPDQSCAAGILKCLEAGVQDRCNRFRPTQKGWIGGQRPLVDKFIAKLRKEIETPGLIAEPCDHNLLPIVTRNFLDPDSLGWVIPVTLFIKSTPTEVRADLVTLKRLLVEESVKMFDDKEINEAEGLLSNFGFDEEMKSCGFELEHLLENF